MKIKYEPLFHEQILTARLTERASLYSPLENETIIEVNEEGVSMQLTPPAIGLVIVDACREELDGLTDAGYEFSIE